RHKRKPQNATERALWDVSDTLGHWALLLAPEEMAEFLGHLEEIGPHWGAQAWRRVAKFVDEHPHLRDPKDELHRDLSLAISGAAGGALRGVPIDSLARR